ncbi:hypothetical protein TPHA_0N00680 [Tetrapisispora phaffii CBS 4417]|uniref:Adenylate cyclase n=1 Tax=Tetrapisispora phaffii (strain ATCC 24235 / CBS 4417 / NBRC 1672 / NRRL Y-8282 / UCD 70-5) TaxID=1071381 RepID=G8C121_TETPH|nr:hypothetical protein TPHA_0N00680 [Tetrapisispora phaffii CBS 4417]CCE65849.1 hypothetical protein TPHA_0N00680 [Tetrapisispora phaffii CBS 4417]
MQSLDDGRPKGGNNNTGNGNNSNPKETNNKNIPNTLTKTTTTSSSIVSPDSAMNAFSDVNSNLSLGSNSNSDSRLPIRRNSIAATVLSNNSNLYFKTRTNGSQKIINNIKKSKTMNTNYSTQNGSNDNFSLYSANSAVSSVRPGQSQGHGKGNHDRRKKQPNALKKTLSNISMSMFRNSFSAMSPAPSHNNAADNSPGASIDEGQYTYKSPTTSNLNNSSRKFSFAGGLFRKLSTVSTPAASPITGNKNNRDRSGNSSPKTSMIYNKFDNNSARRSQSSKEDIYSSVGARSRKSGEEPSKSVANTVSTSSHNDVNTNPLSLTTQNSDSVFWNEVNKPENGNFDFLNKSVTQDRNQTYNDLSLDLSPTDISSHNVDSATYGNPIASNTTVQRWSAPENWDVEGSNLTSKNKKVNSNRSSTVNLVVNRGNKFRNNSLVLPGDQNKPNKLSNSSESISRYSSDDNDNDSNTKYIQNSEGNDISLVNGKEVNDSTTPIAKVSSRKLNQMHNKLLMTPSNTMSLDVPSNASENPDISSANSPMHTDLEDYGEDDDDDDSDEDESTSGSEAGLPFTLSSSNVAKLAILATRENSVNSNNVSSLPIILTAEDEKRDQAERDLQKYYKDVTDLDPKKHYAIRFFNVDKTFTTLSLTPDTTVQEVLPILRKKFNIASQGNFQLSLKVGKLSKILKPTSRPIIIERKLLLLIGYRKTDPLHIIGIEDLSFVFKFHIHPVAPSHLNAEQEQRLMRSDFVHVDLRRINLTTPPIIFYQHTSEIESLDVSNNSNIFLPLEFIESALNLSSLRMVNLRASKFPANVTEAYKLVSLELQRNFIKKVPTSISNLINLTILNLQCNSLEKLPKGFTKLKNLQLLDLSSNNFVEYPEVVNGCTNLLQMDMSYNKMYSLPNSMNQLIKIAKINFSHNKLTAVGDLSGMKCLRTLNLSNNRITVIKTNASNLQNLMLSDNRISTFDDTLPKLRALDIQENPITSIPYKDFYPMNMTSLTLSKAKLASIPGELFSKLSRLEKLDLSQNNLTKLPSEISNLNKLIYLSVARNKLEGLPAEFSQLKNLRTLDLHSNNIRELVPGCYDIEITYLNISSNAFNTNNFKESLSADLNPNTKISKSLMFFIGADNQFDDSVWSVLNSFANLKILNLSYNNLTDLSGMKLANLNELYLSGNKISNLASDTVLKWQSVRTLMLNGNNLLSLPTELSQLSQLTIFDVGSNKLKYNISNYHYDWNWRENKELRYLNFSGNRRFEIKSSINYDIDVDLSDLTILPQLKILGLMDVTLNTNKVQDENINFRLRTSNSTVNGMAYGVADTLGQKDYVSSRDVTFEKFRGKDDECLICLHDSKTQGVRYGHNVTEIVRDIYDKILKRQLDKYTEDDEGIKNALRFSFLQLNKEINIMLNAVDNGEKVPNLSFVDLLSGTCSTVIYMKGSKVYTANVGDCMSILSKNNGDCNVLTTHHVPYKREEYERIKIAGGYVSNSKLDGAVDVSRAIGFFDLLPHIHASPDISVTTLTSSDDMLVVATHKLWEYMDYETACDITREHSGHPLLAAEEMKDHAIAYGCSDNITILCLSLQKDAQQQGNYSFNRNSLISRRTTFEDTTLRRLQPEIAPPTGNVAIIFTDIKNSTFLWELFPNAMRSVMKTHNDIMRRQLRIYGGYEVKTEGDSFMVAFPTPTSALVWCLSVQLKLLDAEWPEEITSIQDGSLVLDKFDNKIYQGLSVRMGIHWGYPVPELDMVTQRMDYLGPVVNKAARVSGIADGGQIALSNTFCVEFNKILSYHDMVVNKNKSLEEAYGEKLIGEILEKEVAQLVSIGWSFFEFGEQKLKGLESKEYITIAYPKILETRHDYSLTESDEKGLVDGDLLFRLLVVNNKLDFISSAVNQGHIDKEVEESGSYLSNVSDANEASIMSIIADIGFMPFFEQLVTRLETCVAMLQLRQRVQKNLNITQEGANAACASIFELLDEIFAAAGIENK